MRLPYGSDPGQGASSIDIHVRLIFLLEHVAIDVCWRTRGIHKQPRRENFLRIHGLMGSIFRQTPKSCCFLDIFDQRPRFYAVSGTEECTTLQPLLQHPGSQEGSRGKHRKSADTETNTWSKFRSRKISENFQQLCPVMLLLKTPTGLTSETQHNSVTFGKKIREI